MSWWYYLKYKNLAIFSLFIIFAIMLSRFEAFHAFLLNLGNFGYIGAFIAGILLFFLGYIGYKLLFSNKKGNLKCNLCPNKEMGILVLNKSYEGGMLGSFCINHLIEKYSDLFITSTFKKVMVEFQPLADSNLTYSYFPISEFLQYEFDKQHKQILQQLLASISDKKCDVCRDNAQVLFVSKEAAPYQKYKWYPSLEFLSKGQYLCNKHTLPKIIPGIQANPKPFGDEIDIESGLWLPYKGDGFQVTYPI